MIIKVIIVIVIRMTLKFFSIVNPPTLMIERFGFSMENKDVKIYPKRLMNANIHEGVPNQSIQGFLLSGSILVETSFGDQIINLGGQGKGTLLYNEMIDSRFSFENKQVEKYGQEQVNLTKFKIMPGIEYIEGIIKQGSVLVQTSFGYSVINFGGQREIAQNRGDIDNYFEVMSAPILIDLIDAQLIDEKKSSGGKNNNQHNNSITNGHTENSKYFIEIFINDFQSIETGLNDKKSTNNQQLSRLNCRKSLENKSLTIVKMFLLCIFILGLLGFR